MQGDCGRETTEQRRRHEPDTRERVGRTELLIGVRGRDFGYRDGTNDEIGHERAEHEGLIEGRDSGDGDRQRRDTKPAGRNEKARAQGQRRERGRWGGHKVGAGRLARARKLEKSMYYNTVTHSQDE